MVLEPCGRIDFFRAHAFHERSDGPLAQGVLHEAVRERGAGEHDGHLHEIHPPRRLAREVARVHEQEQRVVPQVDAVRTQAYPYKRLRSGEAPEQARRMHHHRDDDGGEHGGQQDAAAVEERREAVHEHDEAQQGDERDDSHAVQDVAHLLRKVHALLGSQHVRGPHERQPCADKQRERAGVGAVVHAARVVQRVVQQRHLQRRQEGDDQRGIAHSGALHARFVGDQQHDRPDEVELLFDGERPEVGERRGSAQRVEIRSILEDVPPVRHPEQRGPHVVAQLREQAVVEQGAECGGAYDDQHDGRHEPSHASQPELWQVDGFGVVPLDEQQAGYEIARQHEEHRDAQQASRSPLHPKMVGDNGEDGERAQSVECGNIA